MKNDYFARAEDFVKSLVCYLHEIVHTLCPESVETRNWSFPDFDCLKANRETGNMQRSKAKSMRPKIFLSALIILFSGCGVKHETPVKKDTSIISEQKDVSLKQKKYTGMYTQEGSTGKFFECETGKHFIISPEGDNSIFETVYNTFDSNNPKRKIYLSAEGFSSVRQNISGNGFDTILVITNLIGTDTTHNCEK